MTPAEYRWDEAEGTPGGGPFDSAQVVGRTFGWFGRYRRLAKDSEEQPRNSETMIRLAMINRMLHRLPPGCTVILNRL